MKLNRQNLQTPWILEKWTVQKAVEQKQGKLQILASAAVLRRIFTL